MRESIVMDSAIAALFGASIGASAGVVGVLLTNWLQIRAEHQRWIRDKKSEAYSNTLQHLYRLTAKRSRLLANGVSVLSLEHQKEWLDDYIATVESLSLLAIFASDEFQANIEDHAVKIRTEFEALLRSPNNTNNEILDVSKFLELTENLEDELINAAQRDLRLTRRQEEVPPESTRGLK
jgi:hypothetical protein